MGRRLETRLGVELCACGHSQCPHPQRRSTYPQRGGQVHQLIRSPITHHLHPRKELNDHMLARKGDAIKYMAYILKDMTDMASARQGSSTVPLGHVCLHVCRDDSKTGT